MTALQPATSKSIDGPGVRCPCQGAPSEREMTIGQGLASPNQPDKGRITTCRAGLESKLRWGARTVTVVGNRGEPSGESRLSIVGSRRRTANVETLMMRSDYPTEISRIALIVAGVILLSMPATFAQVREPPLFGPGPFLYEGVLPVPGDMPTLPPAPRSAGSYYKEGDKLFRQGQFEAAIEAFRAAKNRGYHNAAEALSVTYQNLAVTALQEDRIDQATSALRGLLEFNREQAVAYLLDHGGKLVARQQYRQAVAAYEAVGEDSRAYEGIASAEYGRKNIGRAIAALDNLARFDSQRAALAKGDILLNIGAIPLAVQEYSKYPDDPNVKRVLSGLKQSGLDRFDQRLDEQRKWFIFEPSAVMGFERTARYMFEVEAGRALPTPMVVVSVRPAPRPWSLRLAWSAFRRWTWPATDDAMRYKLTVIGVEFSDVVAFWDDPPSETEILAAAWTGKQAVAHMRDGERSLHETQYEDHVSVALSNFRAAANLFHTNRSDWHYSGLVNAVNVAAGAGHDELEHLHDLLVDRFPYWGRIAWAATLAEQGNVDAARTSLKGVADDWPQRYDALEQLADLEWSLAKGGDEKARAVAVTTVQQVLAQILKRRPGWAPALIRLAEIHFKLGSYALAVEALDSVKGADGSGESASMRRILENLNQDSFDNLGHTENTGRGLRFEVFRSRKGPPPSDVFDHHAVEIAVLDRDGNHLETFAVSSQALQEGTPRANFLERINHDGLVQTLIRYEGKTPMPLALAQELAAQ